MVELSYLDENKLDKIIAHKRSAGQSHRGSPIIADDATSVNGAATFISDEGETVARKIQQNQRRDFSKADIAAIIAAYQSRISTNKIAAEYNCNRKTICGILKKHGVEVRQKIFKSEEEVRHVIALYEKNFYTIVEIAKQFRVSENTINYLLHENGVKIRSRWDYE